MIFRKNLIPLSLFLACIILFTGCVSSQNSQIPEIIPTTESLIPNSSSITTPKISPPVISPVTLAPSITSSPSPTVQPLQSTSSNSTMSETQAKDIGEKCLMTIWQIKSYHSITTNIDQYRTYSSTPPAGTTHSLTNDRLVDIVNQKMKIVYSYETADEPRHSIHYSQSGERYLINGWQYGFGKSWSKSPMIANQWDFENEIYWPIKLINSAVKVSLTGTHIIDGNECYVLKIVPDLETLTDWAASLDVNFGRIFRGPGTRKEFLNITYKSGTYEVWISKNNYFIMKVVFQPHFEGIITYDGRRDITPYNFTEDFNILSNYSDYDQPFLIEVPPEASNAPVH
jgi:hypothetical protein